MNPRSPITSEWDSTIALENICGDATDLMELFETWLVEEPVLRSRIQKALDHSDAAELSLAAHTLKGTLSLFGFREAQQRVAGLESAGRANQIATAAELFQLVQVELRLARVHISDFFEVHRPPVSEQTETPLISRATPLPPTKSLAGR